MCLACVLARARSRQGRAYLLINLLFVLLAPMPLAHASPSDPTWIEGLYDAADSDDTVSLLTDTVGSVDGDFGKSLSRPCLSTDLMDLYRPVYLSPLSLRHDRGPPVIRAHGSARALCDLPTSHANRLLPSRNIVRAYINGFRGDERIRSRARLRWNGRSA